MKMMDTLDNVIRVRDFLLTVEVFWRRLALVEEYGKDFVPQYVFTELMKEARTIRETITGKEYTDFCDTQLEKMDRAQVK